MEIPLVRMRLNQNGGHKQQGQRRLGQQLAHRAFLGLEEQKPGQKQKRCGDNQNTWRHVSLLLEVSAAFFKAGVRISAII